MGGHLLLTAVPIHASISTEGCCPQSLNCSGLASCLGLLLDLAGLWPASPDISQPLGVSALQSFSTSNNAHPTIHLS